MCHCEEAQPTWQSRSTRPDHRKVIGEIVTAFPRLHPKGTSSFIFQSSGFLHFRAPPLQRTPRQGAKKLRSFDRSFMLALPIFPCSHPQSIVGANELNFCVRDGNRWTLIAINTNYMDKSSRSYRLIRPVARPVCQSASRSNDLCILARNPRPVKHFSLP